MIKNSFAIIALIFIGLSCDCLKTANGPEEPEDEVIQEKLSYRTIIHSKSYIRDLEKTQLIVWRSIEDQNAFFDTASTADRYVRFTSYEDSMVIGIIYGELISVSVTFSIDSVIATPSTQEMKIYSHLHYPVRRMYIKGWHCHFIALPKLDFDVTINEINVSYETTIGEVISFSTFIKNRFSIINSTSTPNFVVLRNKQEQDAFLDTTEVYHFFEFPEFSVYDTSLLVGVIIPKYPVAVQFEIIELISENDTVEVSTQYWDNWWVATLPDPCHPCHFVSIPKKYDNSTFVLNHMGYQNSEIDD